MQLAAGQADHHPVALADHPVVHDRLTDIAAQALGQLVGFQALLLRRGGGFARGKFDDGLLHGRHFTACVATARGTELVYSVSGEPHCWQ